MYASAQDVFFKMTDKTELSTPLGEGEMGYSQKKTGGVCGPLHKTLNLIYDQILRFSLSYL